MTAWEIAGFLACVAVATCAQSITGFALALILLGLTGLFDLAPLPDVANVATVLSLASAVIALRGTRKSLDRAIWRTTVTGSIFGYAIGVALMAWLNANVVMVLRLLLGVVVIACAVIVLVRTEPLAQRSSPASFRGFGVLSGVLGGLFSASGPPLVYQFYRQPMDLEAVRDTLVATLAAGSLVRLLMVVPAGQFSTRSLLLCLLSLPLAMGITWWMRRHPPAWPRAAVLKVVCALLVVTGVGLIGPAVAAIWR
ncbi:TSUP family transporter [Ramlibacter sp. USB13]|uniref:Probable membrane transporter protein n=1 Tax=Ramlibacter cellulosilyticus TaxID=2764187 RepID=A0A923MUR9_9BURK|nr:TSUP family transporter [Ramlibacter cellulosilyticus]MBC5785386.1 TSUP family transporter [Ramlibacter cellulosilyticus]